MSPASASPVSGAAGHPPAAAGTCTLPVFGRDCETGRIAAPLIGEIVPGPERNPAAHHEGPGSQVGVSYWPGDLRAKLDIRRVCLSAAPLAHATGEVQREQTQANAE